MTKKKRYSFDFLTDSVESQWMENQANRKAAVSILIRNIVQRYGTKDIVDVALENMDLFSNTGNYQQGTTVETTEIEPEHKESKEMAEPEKVEEPKQEKPTPNYYGVSDDNDDSDQVKVPKGLNRLSR